MIQEFLATEFGKSVITFLISMVPIFECRAAIPTGVALGLSTPWVFAISAIGNFIPVPFIVLFITKIFAWMRRKSAKLESLVERLEAKAHSKSERIQKYSAWGLFLFVAIPLPGTGAWTGALIAALLGLKMRMTLPAIAAGILGACVLMTVFSVGAKEAIMLL